MLFRSTPVPVPTVVPRPTVVPVVTPTMVPASMPITTSGLAPVPAFAPVTVLRPIPVPELEPVTEPVTRPVVEPVIEPVPGPTPIPERVEKIPEEPEEPKEPRKSGRGLPLPGLNVLEEGRVRVLGRKKRLPKKGLHWLFPGLAMVFQDPLVGRKYKVGIAGARAIRYGGAELKTGKEVRL